MEKRQLGDVIESVVGVFDVLLTDVASVPEAREKFRSADELLVPLVSLRL